MKKKTALLLLFFLLFTGPLMAQVPLSISKNTDMNFGTIAASSGGTVVLSVSGSRTASGGVILPSFTGTVSAAQFTVTGDSNRTYAITLPTTDLILSAGSATMTVNIFTSTATGILTAGTETVRVGATLNVVASQAAGSYTNATGFDVTVNYN